MGQTSTQKIQNSKAPHMPHGARFETLVRTIKINVRELTPLDA
jgi:hypothetical protein